MELADGRRPAGNDSESIIVVVDAAVVAIAFWLRLVSGIDRARWIRAVGLERLATVWYSFG